MQLRDFQIISVEALFIFRKSYPDLITLMKMSNIMLLIKVKEEKSGKSTVLLKEDSAGSESLFYTWKNQSPQTDPMTPELETDSL